MPPLKAFCFNPFQENTYVISNKAKECLIIDPGCYDRAEEKILVSYIEEHNLKPIRLINTHCHLDHVFGNRFVYERYGLRPEFHVGEIEMYMAQSSVAQMYGVQINPGPEPKQFLDPTDPIEFGDQHFELLLAPGHSPASLCLYNKEASYVIAGDVLFRESIGRTDLPGGDYDTLINSIVHQLLVLDDQVMVYSGHGPATSIGHERAANPFLKEL